MCSWLSVCLHGPVYICVRKHDEEKEGGERDVERYCLLDLYDSSN